MSKNWRVTLALGCGLLFAYPTAWGQDTSPTDAGVGHQQITDCMTQMDPASQKEDAQEICKQKLRQGIKVGKTKKKQPPAEKPAAEVPVADAPVADAPADAPPADAPAETKPPK